MAESTKEICTWTEVPNLVRSRQFAVQCGGHTGWAGLKFYLPGMCPWCGRAIKLEKGRG